MKFRLVMISIQHIIRLCIANSYAVKMCFLILSGLPME